MAWRGNGFYYSRYPAPAKGKELSSINEDHQVYYHRIGTPQSADELVFRDAKNPQRFHTLSTTEDERFAVLDVSDRGTGKQGNAVFVQDLSKPGAKFTPLIPDIGDDTYSVLESVRGELLVFTDNNAPNGRVVRIDPANPAPANWKVILAEKPDTIDSIAVAGGKVIATYMKDVASKAYVHSLEGALENEIELPGLGSVSGFGGNMDDTIAVLHVSRRSPTRRRSSATKSRRERARCSARRRFPASTSTSTRPSRCSSPARTARRCRCSSSTRRASRSTATTRR